MKEKKNHNKSINFSEQIESNKRWMMMMIIDDKLIEVASILFLHLLTLLRLFFD